MSYVSLKEFSTDITSRDPKELIDCWMRTEQPHAFSSSGLYNEFREQISTDWPNNEMISIAGSGNWRYSLNPTKKFSEFHDGSDIDVVVISQEYFERTWQELRTIHKKSWIRWNPTERAAVMRTGQNVYCGFVSPKHIPEAQNPYRFDFLKKCNSYSTGAVGYREVNLMFFKSLEDTIDYYLRGVRLAKGKI
ncbi:hypothetical protein ACNFG0_09810 [Pseudomonas sp. NY15372]|uniref:hypothetical protein n=1 Tax=Pseudomonas sp. NY15372 TaxID=3400356 RepID=UPI003A8A555C